MKCFTYDHILTKKHRYKIRTDFLVLGPNIFKKF